MAIIVEDGTGLENANSYVSVEDADAYFGDILCTEWIDADLYVREAMLIKATRYLNTQYHYRLLPLTDEQALAFPRTGQASVPAKVKTATMDLALLMLTMNPMQQTVQRGVVSESKTLDGVGSKTITYDAAAVIDPFKTVTNTLSGIGAFIGGGSGGTGYLIIP